MKVKDYLLASISGLLLILSFPQWNLFVLAWVSLVPLLFAVRGKDAAQGCILGAVTGLVFNLGLVYWVTVSMTTYGKMNAALSAAGARFVCRLPEPFHRGSGVVQLLCGTQAGNRCSLRRCRFSGLQVNT